MENQGNMTPPKQHSKLPVMDPKEIEIHRLPKKEFKIIVLKNSIKSFNSRLDQVKEKNNQ